MENYNFCFFIDNDFNASCNLKALIPQKDYFKLCTNSSDEKISSPASTEILTPYINEGVLRSKKRNLFYSTPSEKEVSAFKFLCHTCIKPH